MVLQIWVQIITKAKGMISRGKKLHFGSPFFDEGLMIEFLNMVLLH